MRVDKSELNEFFEENCGHDKEIIYARAASKFGITKATALTYYYNWKKEFMKYRSSSELNEDADKSTGNVISKVTEAILLAECLNHGTDAVAIELIAKIYGYSPATILRYVQRYKIKEKIAVTEQNINLDIITEKADIITEKADIVPIIAEKSPISTVIVLKAEQIIKEEIAEIVGGIKEKECFKNLEMFAEEDVFEVTRLIPVTMRGKHGLYNFDKDGVKITANEGYISKDKTDEALEALKVWERCYSHQEESVC